MQNNKLEYPPLSRISKPNNCLDPRVDYMNDSILHQLPLPAFFLENTSLKDHDDFFDDERSSLCLEEKYLLIHILDAYVAPQNWKNFYEKYRLDFYVLHFNEIKRQFKDRTLLFCAENVLELIDKMKKYGTTVDVTLCDFI